MKIAILHLDLGIGGAEKFIVNAALALKQSGHEVTLYTTHHDRTHCFEETLDKDQLGDDIVVCGDWLPGSSGHGASGGMLGAATAICASIRMVYLGLVVLVQKWRDCDAILIDGVSTPLPLFVLCGVPSLFYCHYPDKMLCLNRNTSALKRVYREVLDVVEEETTGCATKVLVNSNYTASVFDAAFPVLARSCRPEVLYPAVEFEKDEHVQKCKVLATDLIRYAVVKSATAEGAMRSMPSTLAAESSSTVRRRRQNKTTASSTAQTASTDTGSNIAQLGFDFMFVSLNRFERKKNIGLALDTMHYLQEHWESDDNQGVQEGACSVLLVVAGGHDERVAENVDHLAELRAKASEYGFTILPSDFSATASVPKKSDITASGVSISVIFRTSISLAERTALLTHATALLYTPHNEHFGIVPIEAMYLRCPVIAVRSGGPMETVQDGKTGFLCEQEPAAFAEAVRKFIVEDESVSGSLTERMGNTGRTHVQQTFSPEAMRQQLDEHMKDVCSIVKGGPGEETEEERLVRENAVNRVRLNMLTILFQVIVIAWIAYEVCLLFHALIMFH